VYQIGRNFKIIFNMNLVRLWFIIYLSLSTEVLAYLEFQADEIPEDNFRDQVARRLQQKGQRRRFNSRHAIPKQRPHPRLTYRFPGRLYSSENISPFTHSSSNRRYYGDKHSLADNQNVISQMFPRQYESDEGYDRFALDTNPEDQIFETPQKVGEDTKSKGDGTEASNFEKEYSSAETDAENFKTAVTDERIDEMDRRLFALVLGGITSVMFGVIAAVTIYYKLKKRSKAAEILTYGSTYPRTKRLQKDDKRLRQAAQMYHFQHQKRRMLAVSSSNGHSSETESDEGNEGDTTLFERRLISSHKVEMKDTQPQDDPTPVTSEDTSAPEATDPTPVTSEDTSAPEATDPTPVTSEDTPAPEATDPTPVISEDTPAPEATNPTPVTSEDTPAPEATDPTPVTSEDTTTPETTDSAVSQ
jgi:hypothetical protein